MNVPQQSARRRQVYFDLPDTRVPERSSKSGRFDLETAASERPHFWFSSTSHAVVSCGDVMKVELSGEKGTPAWVLVSYFDSRAAVAAKAVIANVRHASCAFVDHEASYELRVARIRRLGSGSQASTLQWFSSFGDLESVVVRHTAQRAVHGLSIRPAKAALSKPPTLTAGRLAEPQFLGVPRA
mmetsp:Transcript_126648/g.289675  ORF Transcript_126648/g.289675 Transcript_126648/m.289675 type:complete len:184 (+) Transcript_126648:1735-2286(+)